MRKILSGASLLLTGAILFLSACVAGSQNMDNINGWSTEVGRFWTSVSAVKMMPLVVISIIAMVLGLAGILWGNVSKPEDGKK